MRCLRRKPLPYLSGAGGYSHTYVREMGYTHIELLPVCEHPLDASWDIRRSAILPTSRFGTPEDFMFFVDQCHQYHIGVILTGRLPIFRGTAWLGSLTAPVCMSTRTRERGAPGLGNAHLQLREERGAELLISNALFWLENTISTGCVLTQSLHALPRLFTAGGRMDTKVRRQRKLEAVDFIKQFNEVTHQYFPAS